MELTTLLPLFTQAFAVACINEMEPRIKVCISFLNSKKLKPATESMPTKRNPFPSATQMFNMMEYFKPKQYVFMANDKILSSRLEERTLETYIPGALFLPSHTCWNSSLERRVVEINLARDIEDLVVGILGDGNAESGGSDGYDRRLKEAHRLVRSCLRRLFDYLPARNYNSDPVQDILDNPLDLADDFSCEINLWNFATLSHFLKRDIFNPQGILRDKLVSWLTNYVIHAGDDDLGISLQFVDLCPDDNVSRRATIVLMEHLPSYKRERLLYERGEIPLALTGRPSERVQDFILLYIKFYSDSPYY